LPPGTLTNKSWLYLDIPGAGGGAAAPDEGEVITGHACLQIHTNISWLYLDNPGAGGGAAAPDLGEVITGHASLKVHSQTLRGCTLIFQVRVVVLLLQIKERS
jgi:hypothetical protein